MTLPRALSILTAVAALSAAPAALAHDPAAFRVMSYNIRFDGPTDNPTWLERRPHMAAQIAFLDPDLLGLQEALPHQVGYLAERLPGYDHYGLGRDDGLAGESAALFWRRDRYERLRAETFWCSPTPDRPSKGWDAAYPRTVTRVLLRDRRDGRPLDVRNTHFDHVGVVAREQCAELVSGLAPAEVEGAAAAEVVLMGDFNTGPGTPPYARIVASGLRDARAVSPLDFGPAGTFNAFDIASDNEGVAIDHVFIGPGLAVERFAVPTDSFGGRVISDHFPVVADLVPVGP
ncbi:endonuclease/exonuclease/phosphatase family protein [Brevundimonas sp.]|uniref:endonuclease/exonuclease/phosphatase family protein n=1 Tax=Brevundimonas sp. TaxID=1871086 RepID=UPI002D575BB8|nr:endonuclease/exonuclease/phosphatase family protein [Brevundimonas sp.]HYD26581.1 endonuclease/exonuclease/phosphatase family protein [Brevundimonas sp.]